LFQDSEAATHNKVTVPPLDEIPMKYSGDHRLKILD
jgi:hypothetical protein